MSDRRDPICAEARGKLRVWLRSTAARYARLRAAVKTAEFRRYAWGLANQKGERTRNFLAIKRMIGDAAWLERAPAKRGAPVALFGLLKPRESVTRFRADGTLFPLGALQGCVTVDYLAVGALPGAEVWSGLWTIEAQEHALGRLLQRRPGVDLDAALLELHSNLLRASVSAVDARTAATGGRVLLPAAGGVFLCEMTAGVDTSNSGVRMLNTRTKTWLGRGQLRREQELEIIPPASGPEDEPLGEWYALPPVLRPEAEFELEAKPAAAHLAAVRPALAL